MAVNTEVPRSASPSPYPTEVAEAWSVSRTAQYLQMSDRNVRRLSSDGRLSGYKVPGRGGHEWRILKDSAQAYKQRQQVDNRTQIVQVSESEHLQKFLDGLAELSEAIGGYTAQVKESQQETVEALAGVLDSRLERIERLLEQNHRSIWQRLWPWSKGGTDND